MVREHKRIIVEIVLVLLVIILSVMYFNKNSDYKEQLSLNSTATAELVKWKDKDSLNNAKIEVLTTQNTKDFLAFRSLDSSIAKLQSDVKEMSKYLKKQGSVTNLSTTTTVDITNPTEVIENPEEPQSPTYKSNISLKDKDGKEWIYGESIAKRDSTSLFLKVKNDYTLTVGLEPQGFLGLGKPKPFAQVKNLNPWSEVNELRTYQVSLPPPKRFGVGVIVGYGLGNNGQLSPIIGVGMSYNLIGF